MYVSPFKCQGCLNDLGLFGFCAGGQAHFICDHELRPISVGHPFSFVNSFLSLTLEETSQGNYYL